MSEKINNQTFAQVPRGVLHDKTLTSRAVHLYALLDFHAGKSGSCWPSQQFLADAMGCSVDSVQRAARELEAAGHVETCHRLDQGKRLRSNIYSLAARARPIEGEHAARVRSNRPHGCGVYSRTGAVENQSPLKGALNHNKEPDDNLVSSTGRRLEGASRQANPDRKWADEEWLS